MLGVIKKYFKEQINVRSESSEHAVTHATNLATAALLIEVMRADFEVSDDEQQMIKALLRERLMLGAREVDDLFAMAEEEVVASVSLYQFTTLVDQGLEYSKKVHIIEMAWQVVFADNILDKYEEALLRKLADLLHISHRDFIQAKHRVMPD